MTKIFSFFTLTLFLFACEFSFAKENFEEQFQQGKQLYLEAKYSQAMAVFLPLTKEAKGNKYVETSQYFYALSAFKDKKTQDAYYMLLQLTQKYGTWNNIEEANYLAAAVSFELKKYRYALNFLKNKEGKIQEDVDAMKVHYLTKVQPLDTLIALQKSYSKDAVLARVLANKLQITKPLNEKQGMLMQYLLQEFKIQPIAKPAPPAPSLKDAYNVAALFPWMLNNGNFDNYIKGNSYVQDIYLGMTAAVDSLKKEGIVINLVTYDTGKDNVKLATLLQNAELRNVDLIFGPLLPVQNTTVNTFAEQNGIIAVNPISNNSKIIDKTEQVILFQPTLESQAGVTAALVSKQWVSTTKNKAAIFWSDNARDSLFAIYYRDSLLALKIQVPIFEKIRKDRLFRLSTALNDTNRLKGYTHACVLSTDEIVAATVISALEKSMNTMPVIARAEWLQLSTLNLEQLQKRNIHFIYPEYVYGNEIMVENFKMNFVLRYNILPTPYAYMGFDMMYYLGHVLKDYGTDLKLGLAKTSNHKGIFMPYLNFANSYTNRYTPIVKFEDMRLKVVNVAE